MKTIVLLAALSSAAFGAAIYGLGGPAEAIFIGASASYDSHVRLGALEFFPNHATAPGTRLDLGTWGTGVPLPFELVVDTKPWTWNIDPALNADGLEHVRIAACAPPDPSAACWVLGWEDWPGQSDFDYNDHVYRVVVERGEVVPEPAAWLLIGVGLVALVGMKMGWRR